MFSARIYFSDCTTVTLVTARLVSSNRTYTTGYTRTSSSSDGFTEITVFADMDAADTIYPQASVSGEGADTCDLEGTSGSNERTMFSGYLAC